jgi:hypothetical protein
MRFPAKTLLVKMLRKNKLPAESRFSGSEQNFPDEKGLSGRLPS